MKLAEAQANAKQHLEAALLLFENFLHSSSTLFSKNNTTYWHIPKNKQKNKWLIIMIMKMKMKKKSHKYDINRPRSKHGHKYSKWKCVYLWRRLYVLSNT